MRDHEHVLDQELQQIRRRWLDIEIDAIIEQAHYDDPNSDVVANEHVLDQELQQIRRHLPWRGGPVIPQLPRPTILKRTPRRQRSLVLKFPTPELASRFEQWLHDEGYAFWEVSEPYED